MAISRMLDLLSSADFLHVPVMNAYHDTKNNVFLNTANSEAAGLEAAGNFVLQPFRYLFNGKTVTKIDPKGLCEIKQTFDYATDSTRTEFLKTAAAVLALPFSLLIGGALKAVSYLSESVRQTHRMIKAELTTTRITLHDEEYKAAGIPELFCNERVTHQGIPCPKPTAIQKLQMQAVNDVCEKLEERKQPHWLDCGTLFGAYRHGQEIPWDTDVDLGCMAKDHKNIMSALRELDPRKYEVQDWSCARMPEMFIRVLIKEANSYLDIYEHNIISDEEIMYKYSWTDSPWVPELVKSRETVQEKPIKKADVFPLKIAQFNGQDVRVPNNWEAFLKVKYGQNIEPAKVWNPATNAYEKVAGHPYWDNHEY